MARHSRFVKAALSYAKAGLKVFPVNRRDKTPAIPAWPENASDDQDQLIEWFRRDEYNIGVCTGPIVVIDVDSGDGKVGPTTFATEIAHLLPTQLFQVRTPSGGSHYWFRAPADTSYVNKVGKWTDVDIRGHRGYVVSFPSVGANGRPYELLQGSLDNIPAVPPKLHQMLDQGTGLTFDKHFDYTPPINEEVSEELLEALRRDRSFTNLLSGQSLAPKGKRDHTLFKLCGRLASIDNFETHPRGLLQLFIPSLKVWADKPSADTSLDQWMALALDKLTRQQKALAAEEAEIAPIRRLMKQEAQGHGPLLLRKDNGLVFWDFRRKEYNPPVQVSNWITQAKECWPPSAPVDLQYLNEKGKLCYKTLDQILREYARQAANIQYVYDEGGWDEETRTVRVRDAKFRKLEPAYNKQVDRWLKNMFGEQYEKAADWLACVPALDKQLCALYVAGPGGAGKTLLKEGIGKMWHQEGGVAAEHCFTQFNALLLKTPFIFLEEGWTGKGSIDLCVNVREMVGGRTHRVEPKGLPKMTLRGYPRLLIIANDDLALASNKTKPLSEDAFQATCERILYIKLDPLASFRSLRLPAEQWMSEDDYTIPQHIWWLHQQRYQKLLDEHEENRFIVTGEPSRFHKRLGTSIEATYAVLQWLLIAIPKHSIQALQDYFEVTDQHIALNVRAITSTWRQFEMYDQFPLRPSMQDMDAVIESFSDGTQVKVALGNAFVLDVEFVVEELERLRLCTRSDFIALIRRIAIKEVQ